MKHVVVRHPAVAFVLLAYLGSWLVWSPDWLGQNGLGVLPTRLESRQSSLLNIVAAVAGPFLAALVCTWACGDSVRAFLRRLVQPRGSRVAYLLALVAIPVLLGLGAVLWPSSPGPRTAVGPLVVGGLITYVLYAIAGGPLAEEPGWRGFLLPRLQGSMPPLAAALVVGAVWWGWHLPQYLMPAWNTPHENVLDHVSFLVLCLACSVVLSWVTNSGHLSILLPILGHNGVNWAMDLAPKAVGRAGSMTGAAVGALLLAVVAVVATRGQLGRRPAE